MTKYNARKVVDDGITFDSQAEHRRYCELRLLQQAGQIANLQVHVPYQIVLNDVKIARYVADFVYDDLETGQRRIEDVKGMRTDVYKLKKKLVEAQYGVEIYEVAA